MPKSHARYVLREATAHDHEQVDRAFSGYDLREESHYRSFLAAHARAFLPVEAGLERIDLTRALTDWPDRRRAVSLTLDLKDLGTAPILHADPMPFGSVAAALGAIYVLEGSRLGGAMLVRSIPPHLPRRFLGAGNAALWRKLVEVLDAMLVSQDDMTAAISAARAVFARFEASARCRLEDVAVERAD